MNDFTAFGSAIDSKLRAAGTVGIYYALAPQGAALPYCVFQRNALVDDYVFGTTAYRGVSSDYVVKIVSNRYWPHEAYEVWTHIRNALQNASLTISGATALQCRQVNSLEYQDEKMYWHVGGVFRVDAWET